jgi:hypothetical protein
MLRDARSRGQVYHVVDRLSKGVRICRKPNSAQSETSVGLAGEDVAPWPGAYSTSARLISGVGPTT